MLEKRLKNKALIEFLMLQEVPRAFACLLAAQTAVSDSSPNAVREHFLKTAFSLIGKPYHSMYNQKTNVFHAADAGLPQQSPCSTFPNQPAEQTAKALSDTCQTEPFVFHTVCPGQAEQPRHMRL